jgi:hypothetical protein
VVSANCILPARATSALPAPPAKFLAVEGNVEIMGPLKVRKFPGLKAVPSCGPTKWPPDTSGPLMVIVPLNVAETSPFVISEPLPPESVRCVVMVMLLRILTPLFNSTRALF